MKALLKDDLIKGKKVYYIRIIPKTYTYDVCDLILVSITDNYFTGVDKRDGHTYLLSYKELNKTVFKNRYEALDIVQKAEENKPKMKNLDDLCDLAEILKEE